MSESEKITSACPFCGLACDDLNLRVEDGRIHVQPGLCERAEQGFQNFDEDLQPMVEGRPATMEEAIAQAARILAAARRPFYSGLDADIVGIKAVLRLAEKTSGIVDHGASAASFAHYRALQIDGGFQTTLSEVANRADLFIFFATNGVDVAPRLFQKWIWRDKKLFRDPSKEPHLIFIGPDAPPPEARHPSGAKVAIHHIKVATDALPEVATALRMLWKVNPDMPLPKSVPKTIAGVKVAAWREVIEAIRRADYGVMSWYGGNFPEKTADLIVRMLSQWIQEINQTQRFAALPLGGAGNAIGAAQVSTWQNGFPLRVAYGQGGVEHDSWKFSHQSCADEGDLLVWISCFNATPIPSNNVPRIVLAASAAGVTKKTEVFLPLAVPGIDHAGTVVRCDSSVSVPLNRVRHRDRHRDRWPLNRVIAGIEEHWSC